ncbi:MAG TPA: LytTR family DNA-binding domain-containing protein [Longimicrobium sp.]|nr:LytTR family DNA-binding domain-containing protein [Longimicrobium sp.]
MTRDPGAPLRVLIVDDEPLARELLASMLAGEPDVRIAGECGDGAAAVAWIEAHAPDLVFLDVQMPELDGFGVVQAVGADRMPATVFVTAYDQYALRAFDANALDYLLKPFDEERLARTLERVRRRVAGPAAEMARRVESLLRAVEERRRYAARLVVRNGVRTRLVPVDGIVWIEAEGKHSRVHLARESHVAQMGIGAVEAQLDPEHFVRAHRGAIVRIDQIQEIQPWFKGEYLLLMAGGAQVTTSAAYRPRIRDLLGLAS